MDAENTLQKRKRFLINMGYFMGISVLLIFLFRYALSALLPFVLAVFAALILLPVQRLLHEKLKCPKRLGAILLTLLFYLLILFLAIVLLGQATGIAKNFLTSFPQTWESSWKPTLTALGRQAAEFLDNVNIDIGPIIDSQISTLGNSLLSYATSLLVRLGSAATSIPSMLVKIIICIAATLFLLLDWDNISAFLLRQISSRHQKIAQITSKQSLRLIRQYIVSYGLILLITFAELIVAFLLIGIDRPVLLATLIAVFDILPIVGCGWVLIPWALISLLIGQTVQGLSLLAAYLVITVIRNIIEPKIVGQKVGLHPLVTLLSMVIGSSLFGAVGLLALPVAVAVINQLNDAEIIHLYQSKQGEKD